MDQSKLSLVKLHLAVRIVYAAVYGRQEVAPTYERLDGLAQAIICLVPLYRKGAEDAEAQRVPESLLRDGIVRQGGREIRYADGRPPLGDLFISRTGIEHVVQQLGPVMPDPDMPVQEAPVSGLARPSGQ